jgi:hypothetical protein
LTPFFSDISKKLLLCTGDIASFYNNVAGVDAFLTPCLSYASSKVPSASQFNTPIYFGGTAGLRLLKYSFYLISYLTYFN